jgi:protein O-mannosyl-transferase
MTRSRRPARASRAPVPAPASRAPLLLAIGLAAITVAVYAAVRDYAFLSLDDHAYVAENPHVLRGLTWDGIVWALTSGHAANWHPLTWMSHMLDVQLFGLDAGAHHLVNLSLHVANTLVLFSLLRRLTGAIGRSAVVAALFAVHPLHVESVAWIAERKDVLSTLLLLLTLHAYVTYVREPGARRYVVVVLLFALGLMAKPMLVTLPFLMLLLDWWPLGRALPWTRLRQGSGATAARLVGEKLPLVALSIASSVVTFLVQQASGATRGQDVYSLGVRIANACRSYAAYLGGLIWPANVSPFYPYRVPVPVTEVAIGIALLAGVSAAGWFLRKRAPYLLMGWLWFVGMLVPVIGLIQVGGQARADRYTYVPFVGLFIAIVWGVAALAERRDILRRTLPALTAAVVVALALTAHAAVQPWRDSVSLWQQALAADPANYRAHAAVGALLTDMPGRMDEAIAHLNEAVRLQPAFAEAQQNLGLALVKASRVAEAIPHLGEAARLLPASVPAKSDYGLALAEVGRFDEAIAVLDEAVRIDPANAEAQNNLGSTLARANRIPEALPHMAEAVRLDRNSEQAHVNYALALAQLGRTAEAIREFDEVLRINPRNAQARAAANALRGKSP